MTEAIAKGLWKELKYESKSQHMHKDKDINDKVALQKACIALLISPYSNIEEVQ